MPYETTWYRTRAIISAAVIDWFAGGGAGPGGHRHECPHASALLDLTSTAKGLLTPPMTAAQRAAVAAPATGLLVYQTDGAQPGFRYNAGTPGTPTWTFFNPSADNLGNHTATQNLNMQGQALTGTGADIGNVVGLGVRADGGLNIGQNTNGNVLVDYQSGQNDASTSLSMTVLFLAYSDGLLEQLST